MQEFDGAQELVDQMLWPDASRAKKLALPA
jgi:hypothetical protein